MKRLLMMTTAIGLCLAAPAFAQTMDSQTPQAAPGATAPSTNASPAPETQRNSNTSRGQSNDAPSRSSSSGNGSPNAQAPTSSGRSQSATGNQNQGGQAQNQQQPSSPSSAQTPASSNPSQSATGNQNQRQQGNAATNTQAPADRQRSSTSNQNQTQGGQAQQNQQRQRQDARQSRQDQRQDAGQDRRDNRQDARQDRRDNRQDARGSNNDRVSASVNVTINDNQRSRIASVISNSRVRPVNVNFRVATGVVVPTRITLNALPADIVSIVPQYRGYRYFVTGEQVVIVEPARKTIVAVIPAGGTAQAQAPAAGRVSFSDQQRQLIRSRASTMRSPVTTGSSSQILIEQEVPEAIELEEFPVEIVTEVPTIRTYRYFRQDNDVVVVDPTQRRVIEIIR